MSQSSVVWEFFELNSVDPSRAKCKVCKTSISRGRTGAPASPFTTTNMRKHLRNVHGELLQKRNPNAAAEGQTVSTPSTSSGSTTIAKLFDNQKPWKFDDERSRKIHRLVGEMIATDDQPFNIVNNEGFRRLAAALEPRYSLPSDKYFRID